VCLNHVSSSAAWCPISDVQLRPYQPRDFAALYEIDHACFPRGIAYSKRMLRYFLAMPTATCLLAVDGEKIGGFILGEMVEREAHIVTLDVAEAFRRRGLGSLLLNALEDSVTRLGARAMVLETAVNNDAAIALWKRHGYRQVGILKRYYLGKTDALQMRKLLPRRATRPGD
jgi:ribosomal-protein-alanine N-acetyltransferase